MSSLAQDDADRERTYGLPRMSAPWRLEEARRLEEEVIEDDEFTRVMDDPKNLLEYRLAGVLPAVGIC